jgi:GTPase
MARRPTVAVVGRPNVGKSSLVNRLVGRRVTVVESSPGVTRDRKVVPVEWLGTTFDLVDTGGWLASGSSLDSQVSGQADRAVEDADLVLFVVDASVGVTDEDVLAARWVLRSTTRWLLVANKVDDDRHEAAIWEFLQLGAGEPIAVSALHGRGVGDLLDRIVARIAPPLLTPSEDDGPAALGVAIVGRPNVGKSTLFNRLIGDERSVVHDLPGTTRDAVDTVVETEVGLIRFIDTAGLKRRARTQAGVETYATLRSLEALDRADVALLVIDASSGATAQDQRLAERIAGAGCPAIVVLNKWELVSTEQRPMVTASVADKLAFLGAAPVLKISAQRGRGVHKILPALSVAATEYEQRVPTAALNRAVREIQTKQSAPGARIRYAVQGAVHPPTFTLFCSGRLAPTYLRYVERGLRERFGLGSTPLKLRVRID